MREFDVEKKLDRVLIKLSKKDKKLYEIIWEKIKKIVNNSNIEHYKNLRKPLQTFKRVQVGSFVLIFKYNKETDKVVFYDFDHHDKIYK